MGPLEFLDQLRAIVTQGRRQHPSRTDDRLILNRAAVALLAQAISDGVPGGTRLPYAVSLGQAGQVGFVEGCRVFYDPSLDSDAEPVARYQVETDDDVARG